MSNALRHLVLARLRESLREPEAIFWTFVFPALLAAALGVAFRGGSAGPADVVVASSPGAGPIADALRADNTMRVLVVDGPAAEHRLRTGRAAILVIPGSPVTYRYDPARPESLLARAGVDAALQAVAGRTDPVPVRDDRVSEPGARYIDFLIPGLLGMNLMGGGVWGIGWVVVETRIKKLLKLQLTTPMRRRDFLLSHMLTRLAYVPLEVVPLLLLARWLFGVTVAGSVATLAVVAAAGAFSFAGLGTLLASRARTTGTIMGLINLVTLPMFVLSGVFFSTSRFPAKVQPILAALPLTALNDALRAVMGDGASLLSLGPQFAILVLWGAVGFAAALRWFRWS